MSFGPVFGDTYTSCHTTPRRRNCDTSAPCSSIVGKLFLGGFEMSGAEFCSKTAAEDGKEQSSQGLQKGEESEQDVQKSKRELWGPKPSREDIEAFLAGNEQQAREKFMQRWGFDPSAGEPLPQHDNPTAWEWELVEKQDKSKGPTSSLSGNPGAAEHWAKK